MQIHMEMQTDVDKQMIDRRQIWTYVNRCIDYLEIDGWMEDRWMDD